MESTKIFYFSGTGNSLYVAKRICELIPNSELVPIIGYIQSSNQTLKCKKMGLVFPIQGPMFLTAVKQFLDNSDLTDVEYIFSVSTRGGTTCRTEKELNKLLKIHGKKINANFIITMFNNDPKLKSMNKNEYDFHIPNEDEVNKKIEYVTKNVKIISNVVVNEFEYHMKDTEYGFKYGFFFEKLIIFATKLMSKKSIKNYFYINQNCIGCGICSNVCLSNRINLINTKPIWDDKILCHMCYACLNYCPKNAVEINSKWYMKSYTTTQERYSHPFASAKDIEIQKKI